MKDIHDIIKGPVLTEKAYDNIAVKKYTFSVATSAHKTEIKQAIEQIFGVKVASVNTARREGKMKRQGRTMGRTPEVKLAYVKLKPGSKTIAFFDEMTQ